MSLANFGAPWDSSKLCAHNGKTRKNCIFKILHGVMFFLHGPSIMIFSKKLTSMDMISLIVYNFNPTHIILNKCWISKKKNLSQNNFFVEEIKSFKTLYFPNGTLKINQLHLVSTGWSCHHTLLYELKNPNFFFFHNGGQKWILIFFQRVYFPHNCRLFGLKAWA